MLGGDAWRGVKALSKPRAVMPCQVWGPCWLPEEGTPTAGHSSATGWPQERKEIPQARVWDQEEEPAQGQGWGRTYLCQVLLLLGASLEHPQALDIGSTECPNPHCGSTEGQLCTKGHCAVDGECNGKVQATRRCSHIHSTGLVPTH